MNRHVIGRIIGVLVGIALLAAVGGLAYQAGLAQGAAAQLGAAGEGLRQFGPAGGRAFGVMPWLGFGLGFGLLGVFLKGLFFIALVALAVRLVFRRRWGHGPWGPGPHDVPPMFAEWHRRAHGEGPAAEPAAPPASNA